MSYRSKRVTPTFMYTYVQEQKKMRIAGWTARETGPSEDRGPLNNISCLFSLSIIALNSNN